MIRIAANLSTLFADLPIEARFEAAARAGFAAVEMQFPYAWPAGHIAALLAANGLTLALINAPAGDFARGDRGLVLGDEDAFRRSIDQAIAYAQATDCRRVHVLIGNGPPDAVAVRRLREAARRFAGHGVALMLEALNPLDQPGYALPDLAAADALRIAIGEDNVRLQLDAYHLLRSGGDPLAAFDRLGGHVGHIQIADPSDRGEPSEPVLFDVLDAVAASGWDGFVGAEYNPRGKTAAGLGWARRYGVVPGERTDG
ncbi:hydroxypyruvate isomerase family protein [Rhizorhabdus histidinilytica]|uniref:hydroxypyruvate isomerase family protein n=1 Tax=Rhizorhabdus histidinilytica TaxID=439228 RepID=UPI00321F8991